MLRWLQEKGGSLWAALFDSGGRLMEKGLELQRSGEYDEALSIAARLRARRYSGCFELEALVHNARGEPEKALAVLEEGVRAAPSVFLNQMLLGSTLSDLGRYEEALDAYDRASGCRGVFPGYLPYNRALVYRRQGKLELALRELPWKPSDPDLRAEVESLRSVLLDGLERWADLEAQVRERPESAEAHYFLGRAYRGLGRLAEALAEACEAVRQEPGCEVWGKLVEELAPGEPLRQWRLLYRGPSLWKPKEGRQFCRVGHVVAESLEAAFALLAAEEPPEIRAQLTLGEDADDRLDLGPRPEALRGILHRTPYIVAES